MKPLPNIADEAAMMLRGRQSALRGARADATQELRDAYTLAQGADWHELRKHAEAARAAAERLLTLAALWAELDYEA